MAWQRLTDQHIVVNAIVDEKGTLLIASVRKTLMLGLNNYHYHFGELLLIIIV